MDFPRPLLKAVMLKRYKRFFADVRLNGELVTAHCPNTGSLRSCWEEGRAAYVSLSDNPDRKLKYTLELTEAPTGALVGVNTSWPNKLIFEAYRNGVIADWKEFSHFQNEVKISKETRLDGCLMAGDKKRFIEVKNVTLVRGSHAQFPDAETTRGQKHLRELLKLRELGHEAEVVFVIQREDAETFSAAEDFDPEYARLLVEAHRGGVHVRPLLVRVSPESLHITGRELPWKP
ncbi:MAG: DNA/RNA nuclease SfsA [Bdellovibrionales bacterium]